MSMWRRRLHDQRGTVILFTAVILVALVAMGGFATDMAYMMAAKGELQRSVDAAALAGAAKIGLTTADYPSVRDFAQRFASANQYRLLGSGKATIGLNLNSGNGGTGNIVLGNWSQDAGFLPTLDPAQVNAVRCQWSTTVPTSFLNIIGFPTLPVSAQATAVVLPPQAPGPSVCNPMPIGISACAVNGSPCGAFVAIRLDQGPAVPNSGTWVSIDDNPAGKTPAVDASNLKAALEALFARPDMACLPVNRLLSTDPKEKCANNKCPDAFQMLTTDFKREFDVQRTLSVIGGDGNVVYSGKGWQVLIPILPSACPAPPWPPAPTPLPIAGWARFVVTQVIYSDATLGTKCAVTNPADPQSNVYCAQAAANPGWRVVFGYLQCASFPGAPVGILGGPGTSVVPSPKLVN